MTEKNVDEFNDELVKVLEEKIKDIKPLFDSIIIFATKHNDDKIGTTRIKLESGNFFANYGMTKLWVKEQTLDRGEE